MEGCSRAGLSLGSPGSTWPQWRGLHNPGVPWPQKQEEELVAASAQKVFVVHGVITVGAVTVSFLMKQMNIVWGEEMW